MSPEDVLIEAMSQASLNGDNPKLRQEMCRKLENAISERELLQQLAEAYMHGAIWRN